jgi:serine/threonine-protein kinase
VKACRTCNRKLIDSEQTCPLDDTLLIGAPGQPPAGVGRTLGAYRLICLLGEGGMGNIYVGRHEQLKRVVAIKVLRPELAKRKDNVARFFHEAHTINRLRHPNIVESIDLVDDAADAYSVLELLKGHDLKTRLARGALPIESVIQIGVQLSDALGKVHALGVVHRDLKPENLILIRRDGRDDFVKLIDFGIAQIGSESEGAIVGTAAYMAPEQAHEHAKVDCRADIYSLGTMLFEMVTGQHPFPSATDGEFLIHHATTKPPRPGKLAPRCPPQLETVILRCLAKNPERRYASADELAASLRAIDVRKSSGSRGIWIGGGLALASAAAAASLVVLPKYLETTNAEARVEPTPEAALPPATPAPPVAEPEPPAAPSIVEIGIVSTPAGASVYRVGETVALGTTPFTVPLPSSDKPVKMRFEKAGFESKTIEVPIAASLEIEVELAAPVASKVVRNRGPAEPATKPKVATPLQREGTIDPFAK